MLDPQQKNDLLTLRHDGLPTGEMRTLCAAGGNESFNELAMILQQEFLLVREDKGEQAIRSLLPFVQ